MNLLRISRAGIRSFASKWFLLGFRSSGAGFNADTMDVANHSNLRSLLLAEFDRLWNESHETH